MAAVTVKYLRHANRRNLVQATSLLPYLSPSLPTTATTAGTNDHWTVVMLHSSGGGGARRAPLDHASEGSQLCYFLALELLLLLISCDRLRLAPSPGFKKCSTGAFSALRSLARSFPPPTPISTIVQLDIGRSCCSRNRQALRAYDLHWTPQAGRWRRRRWRRTVQVVPNQSSL